MTATLSAALAVGFLGSAHCALMCGPLAAAGCAGPARGRAALAYLLGRAVSYAFAGALLGHAGGSLARELSWRGFQEGAILAVAAVAAARGIFLLTNLPRRGLVKLGPPRGPSRWVRTLAGWIPRRGLGLGLATGAFPCGLLGAGWALAASTQEAAGGALVMLVFSLATAPALLLPIVAARWLDRCRARLTPAWQGALWVALAVWIGARPLLDAAGCH